MKFSNILLILASVCILAILTPMGCGGDAGTATVTLTLSGVPSSCTKITLTVTAEGMDTISNSYEPDTLSVTVDVPAGPLRMLAVLAECPSVYFGASVERSLEAGETVSIDLTLELYETKLLIPDAENNRIVQIDDMDGSGWTDLTWEELGFGDDYEFLPYDIDFDTQGRIYISNYGDTGNVLIRIDDIADTVYDTILGNGAIALAIDRVNDLIYSADINQLYRCDYDGNNPKSDFDMTGITDIRGLAIDDSGMVYIAHGYGTAYLRKYDPSGSGSIVSTYTGVLNDPVFSYHYFDVLVKSSSVYATNANGGADSKVIQLDKDMQFVSGYGNEANDLDTDTPEDAAGKFWGPFRFVAILNKKLYILEHYNRDMMDGGHNRLVSIDDLTGTDWSTYGQTGTGTDEFRFFNQYSQC